MYKKAKNDPHEHLLDEMSAGRNVSLWDCKKRVAAWGGGTWRPMQKSRVNSAEEKGNEMDAKFISWRAYAIEVGFQGQKRKFSAPDCNRYFLVA